MKSEHIRQLVQESFKGVEADDPRAKVNIGDTVKLTTYIIEVIKKRRQLSAKEKQTLKTKGTLEESADKRKTQVYQGVVIAIKNKGLQKTIIVRKMSANNIGVEKTFPMYSKTIQKFEIVERGKPRRSKLYYLRDRVGKLALRVKTE